MDGSSAANPYNNPGANHTVINTIPISREFPDEGSVQLIGSVDIDNLEGLFSFTLYYRTSAFRDSIYFYGLLMYANFLHSMPYFNKVGMIIYTDEDSYSKIKPYFSKYPKLIFGIVKWDAYMINDTMVENTMLRTLRFHATEAFPHAWLAIRDADTIFTNEIKEIILRTVQIDDIIIKRIIILSYEIGKWEQSFMERFMEDSEKTICIGIGFWYRRFWHKNILLKYAPKFNNNLKQFELYQKNKEHPQFIQTPPNGVLAGFANFKTSRPNDIWGLCYNYLTIHYSLQNLNQNNKTKKIRDINNAKIFKIALVDSGLYNIGKDERMIIYGILHKYLEKTHFIKLALSPDDKYSIQELGVYEKSLNINSEKTIYTVLLQNNYIPTLYDNKENDEFAEQMQKFFVDYDAAANSIDNMTNDNIRIHLNEILKDKKQNTNFFEPVRRIPRTRRRVGGRRQTKRRSSRTNN